MANELTYVLINPAALAKSRTGGIISRIISRTGLEIAGARMFGPSQELTDAYSGLIRADDSIDKEEAAILADYVKSHYGPNSATGKVRRVLMLLFEGEHAIAKMKETVGTIRGDSGSGQTVRDTFGDLVADENGGVRFVEPAVMTGGSAESVRKALALWSDFSEKDGGILDDADDVAQGDDVHRTLVILKPDNFRFASSRPGGIIDLFSASGLRLIGAKIHHMSLAEGLEFYGPVQAVLRDIFRGPGGERATEALEAEFGFALKDDAKTQLSEMMGPICGDHQFGRILNFMTGHWPHEVADDEKSKPGKARCFILIYKGQDAVNRIRAILGPTNPAKADPGTVRKEYGTDVMVNAAHASDSPENAVREMGIVKPEQDMIRAVAEKYYTL